MILIILFLIILILITLVINEPDPILMDYRIRPTFNRILALSHMSDFDTGIIILEELSYLGITVRIETLCPDPMDRFISSQQKG
jgi:hypothetical protein